MITLTNQNVVEEKVEETTSQASSPQAEGAVTEPKNSQEEVATQEPDLSADETSDADVDKTMSEEQRKAFQEMRLEVKRLKEEKEARSKGESAFDAFRPKPQAGGIPDPNSYLDQYTGEMDWGRYNQAVMTQAQSVAAQTVQEQLDENNARQKFPDVFADPDLEEALAGQWLASKLQGKNVSISDLAQRFSKKLSSATTRAEKEGAKKALTELTPKEQASLSVQGVSSTQANTQASAEEEETLRWKARNGDPNALAQLVKGVSWKQ